jgi:hypothetical protein
MSNDFYSPDGAPATGSSGSSAVIRSEFTRLQASFDKMPSLTSTGGRLVRVNPGSTALEAMTLTAGAILYGGGNNEVVQGNNFAWNAANNTLSVLGEIYATQAFRSTGTAVRHVGNSVVLDQSVTTGRLRAYGNSPSNRGSLELHVQASDGTNDIAAISIDTSGNTVLNNLNATTINAATSVLTPVAKSKSGVFHLGSNNTDWWEMNSGGNLYPLSNGVLVLGDPTARIAQGYFVNLNANGAASFNTIDATGTATVNALNSNGNISGTNLNITGALRGTSAMLSPLNNSLAADVNLNNANAFIDGPSVAQGNNGTWFVSSETQAQWGAGGGTSAIQFKLWDGINVISSANIVTSATINQTVHLSGFISSPSGNLRTSAKALGANGKMLWNDSGQQKDSTITAIRIG